MTQSTDDDTIVPDAAGVPGRAHLSRREASSTAGPEFQGPPAGLVAEHDPCYGGAKTGSTRPTHVVATSRWAGMRAVVGHYRAVAHTGNSCEQQVAMRQLARLALRGSSRTTQTAGRWGHVPITDLFVEAGNRLYPRTSGQVETGHEPVHTSKSGRCVLIDPAAGRWWCRSCRTGGDASGLLMSLHGRNYQQATVYLIEHYGLRRGGPHG